MLSRGDRVTERGLRVSCVNSWRPAAPAALFLACLAFAGPPARAARADIPVLVPLTGFLSLEGASQRNGAVLALEHPPAGVRVTYQVSDTATSPEVAVNALVRAVDGGKALAIVAPMLGTQLLAMLPVDLQ